MSTSLYLTCLFFIYIINNYEWSPRLLTGLQTLDKKAVSGNHLDPLNIVFLLHGVLRKRSDLTKYRAIADIPTTKNVAALISIDTRKGRKQLLTLKPARIAIAWGTVIPPVQLILASMISAADVLWRKTPDPTPKSTAFHRGDMNFVASFLKGWLPIYLRIWVRLLMPVNRKPSPTKKRDSDSIGKPETINV